MSLGEILVVVPSNFAVVLVELCPITLLFSGQSVLFWAARKPKRLPSCRTQKNSLFRLLLSVVSHTLFLPLPFLEDPAEVEGQT